MNKKELRKAIIELPVDCSGLRPKIDQLTTLELIKLLDEPKKVAIPQFVAEWYEEHKDNLEYNIWEYIYNWDKQNVSQIKTWFNYSSNKPLQTLINMKQFGYEVEKEKRYYVRLKIDDKNYNYLNYIKHLSAWCLAGIKKDKKIRTEHTRKQLEDGGFGEVFNSTLFEVEEVKE